MHVPIFIHMPAYDYELMNKMQSFNFFFLFLFNNCTLNDSIWYLVFETAFTFFKIDLVCSQFNLFFDLRFLSFITTNGPYLQSFGWNSFFIFNVLFQVTKDVKANSIGNNSKFTWLLNESKRFPILLIFFELRQFYKVRLRFWGKF